MFPVFSYAFHALGKPAGIILSWHAHLLCSNWCFQGTPPKVFKILRFISHLSPLFNQKECWLTKWNSLILPYPKKLSLAINSKCFYESELIRISFIIVVSLTSIQFNSIHEFTTKTSQGKLSSMPKGNLLIVPIRLLPIWTAMPSWYFQGHLLCHKSSPRALWTESPKLM